MASGLLENNIGYSDLFFVYLTETRRTDKRANQFPSYLVHEVKRPGV